MRELEHALLAWLQGHASPWLDQRALEVTALGDGYVVTVLVVATGALLWAFGARVYAACLAAAAAGAGILTPLLKSTFERPRPDAVALRAAFPESSYAYPSGHALLSTATLFVIAYVIHRIARRRSVSLAVGALATLAIALTGLSRLYLGVHYPTDVLAGHALGIAWGVLCITAAERMRTRIGETIPCLGGATISPEPSDRNRMTRPVFVLAGVLGAIAACGGDRPAVAQQLPPAGPAAQSAAACAVTRAAAPLPAAVRETSGLARGSTGFWTHNDAGGDPILYRIDDAGRIAQTVVIEGATLEDWEDIEAAPCDGGTCLYVGDIGDNDAERPHVTIYRVAEPAGDATRAPAQALHLTYPDGARDAEALFVVDGTAYVVTKGRREEIALYRVPANAWQQGRAELEPVRTLLPRPRTEDDRVTAATATPDGRHVAIRSYSTLYVFDAAGLTSAAEVAPLAYDLAALGESQGESIVMDDEGTIWMTNEAEARGTMPSWLQLRCPLE